MHSLDIDYSELQELQLVRRGPSELKFDREISDLSDRQAMGLPLHYAASELDNLEDLFTGMAKLDKEQLLARLESTEHPFVERFAAGQLLALQGDPRIRHDEPEMVSVPAWSGYLGLHEEQVSKVVDEFSKYGVRQEWIRKESPEYFVNIRAFRMAKYPVTNQEYLVFLKETGFEEIPTSWPFRHYQVFYANHPVYSLSSDACVRYAEWLSEKTGRKFRLPTEAEWEYAAGGPSRLEYPWGDSFLKDCANTVESGILQTTAVGSFPKGASPFGCLDMAGNVEEYVMDLYGGYAGGEAVHDDLVTVNQTYRVARGGSFTRFRDLARCKRRHGPNPKAIYAMGFRLAEDVES